MEILCPNCKQQLTLQKDVQTNDFAVQCSSCMFFALGQLIPDKTGQSGLLFFIDNQKRVWVLQPEGQTKGTLLLVEDQNKTQAQPGTSQRTYQSTYSAQPPVSPKKPRPKPKPFMKSLKPVFLSVVLACIAILIFYLQYSNAIKVQQNDFDHWMIEKEKQNADEINRLNIEFQAQEYQARGDTEPERILNDSQNNIQQVVEKLVQEAFPEKSSIRVTIDDFTEIQVTISNTESMDKESVANAILSVCNPLQFNYISAFWVRSSNGSVIDHLPIPRQWRGKQEISNVSTVVRQMNRTKI